MNWKDHKKQLKTGQSLQENQYILGIDLGTTNSVISFFNAESKAPEPIDLSMGFGKIPLASVVQYRPADREWIIGDEAFRTMQVYPDTTIRSVKSLLGTGETLTIAGETYHPEAISAKVLSYLVNQIYNQNPNAELLGLVITIPYDFGQAAKRATLRAVEIAGLSELLIDMIEEPKAAALTYNFSYDIEQGENILVFDFGGGTLDITIFSVTEKTEATTYLKVISEGGSLNHGGDNVDKALFAHASQVYEDKTGQPLTDAPLENQLELNQKIREAKERLSQTKSHNLPFAFAMPPFMEKLTRDKLEETLAPFIDKTRKLVEKALQSCHTGALDCEQIDRVLLEGGSSGMPWVKAMLADMFGQDKIYVSKTPALDISMGATYHAAMQMGLLAHMDMQIPVEINATMPHDIGVEVETATGPAFKIILPKGTSYALAKRSQVFSMSFEDESDSQLHFKLLERQNKDDPISDCRHIGDVHIKDIPSDIEKAKVKLTLGAYENMLIKGDIEITGAYTPFKKEFSL